MQANFLPSPPSSSRLALVRSLERQASQAIRQKFQAERELLSRTLTNAVEQEFQADREAQLAALRSAQLDSLSVVGAAHRQASEFSASAAAQAARALAENQKQQKTENLRENTAEKARTQEKQKKIAEARALATRRALEALRLKENQARLKKAAELRESQLPPHLTQKLVSLPKSSALLSDLDGSISVAEHFVIEEFGEFTVSVVRHNKPEEILKPLKVQRHAQTTKLSAFESAAAITRSQSASAARAEERRRLAELRGSARAAVAEALEEEKKEGERGREIIEKNQEKTKQTRLEALRQSAAAHAERSSRRGRELTAANRAELTKAPTAKAPEKRRATQKFIKRARQALKNRDKENLSTSANLQAEVPSDDYFASNFSGFASSARLQAALDQLVQSPGRESSKAIEAPAPFFSPVQQRGYASESESEYLSESDDDREED